MDTYIYAMIPQAADIRWQARTLSSRCRLLCATSGFVLLVSLCVLLYSQPELPFLVISAISHPRNPRHSQHYVRSPTLNETVLLIKLTRNSCQRTKPKNQTMLHGIWHRAMNEQYWSTTSVYGAYLDDRAQLTIRLFAVSTMAKEDLPYCYIWYHNFSRPVVVRVASGDSKNVGRGYFFEGVSYQEKMYSCYVPDMETIPTHVSLVYRECGDPTNMIPVHYSSEMDQSPSGIGLCVAVSYGNLHPLKLIEWIEFNKLLGVSRIHIYNSSISGPANDVVNYYEGLGFVQLTKSAPPLSNWCQYCQKLAVIPLLNDCLYRNMRRYRYIMVIDLDEVIVPYFHKTLTSLVKSLEGFSGLQHPSFTFRNAYFFFDFNTTDNITSRSAGDLFTMQYRIRADVSPEGYAVKSITNPRMCVVVQNHYCSVRMDDVGSYWAKSVDTRSALLHHYKKCHFNSDECIRYLRGGHLDDSVLKYKKQMSTLVREVREIVFL